jgi:hypothetical protein
MKRITDENLGLRRSVIDVLLAALGCVDDDSSKATCMKIQGWLDKAIEEGRMTKDGRGHYRIVREYFDTQVARNVAQQ